MTNQTQRERIQEAGFTIEEVQISGTTRYRAVREGDETPTCETIEELAAYLNLVDCGPIDDSELIDKATEKYSERRTVEPVSHDASSVIECTDGKRYVRLRNDSNSSVATYRREPSGAVRLVNFPPEYVDKAFS